MDFQDCIRFANENPLCHIATVEGVQPRVRILIMWFADESGFYFQTQSVKALCKQIKNNPKVELCFYAPRTDSPVGKMLRVSGDAEILNDMAIRARAIKERPQVKRWGIEKPEDPLLEVFRIYTGEAHLWTTEYNLRESEIERIKF